MVWLNVWFSGGIWVFHSLDKFNEFILIMGFLFIIEFHRINSNRKIEITEMYEPTEDTIFQLENLSG